MYISLLSVTEDEDLNVLLQYVNPISNDLNVKCNVAIKDFVVMNMAGQEVYREQSDMGNSVEVDSSKWPNGLYIVRLSTGNGTAKSIKILKQ